MPLRAPVNRTPSIMALAAATGIAAGILRRRR